MIYKVEVGVIAGHSFFFSFFCLPLFIFHKKRDYLMIICVFLPLFFQFQPLLRIPFGSIPRNFNSVKIKWHGPLYFGAASMILNENKKRWKDYRNEREKRVHLQCNSFGPELCSHTQLIKCSPTIVVYGNCCTWIQQRIILLQNHTFNSLPATEKKHTHTHQPLSFP